MRPARRPRRPRRAGRGPRGRAPPRVALAEHGSRISLWRRRATTAGARADVASLGHLSNAETHLHVGEVFGGAKTACFVTAGKDLEIVRALRCVIPAATHYAVVVDRVPCVQRHSAT